MTNKLVFAAALLLTLTTGCRKLLQTLAEADEGGVSTQPAAAKTTDVTFVRHPPTSGTKVSLTAKTSLKFTFEGKVFRDVTDEAALVTVQASDDFRVTKAAIDVKQLVSAKQEGTTITTSWPPSLCTRRLISATSPGVGPPQSGCSSTTPPTVH